MKTLPNAAKYVKYADELGVSVRIVLICKTSKLQKKVEIQ